MSATTQPAPAGDASWPKLRPISEAKKDGSIIWAKMRDDLSASLGREDLAPWDGKWAPLRHPGVYEHGGRSWDHGWNIALPVGHGGFPDNWLDGWVDLHSEGTDAMTSHAGLSALVNEMALFTDKLAGTGLAAAMSSDPGKAHAALADLAGEWTAPEGLRSRACAAVRERVAKGVG